MVYRITTADGYYLSAPGQRVNFTPQVHGLCTKRKVSDVALRLGVFLCIIAGLGTRKASWLMSVLFHLTVSKSALDRWGEEVADNLPSEDEMVKLLQQRKPITQGHFDELFPLGTEACVLVLKDEHGRILAAEQVEKRDEEHVKPFLARFQRLGLKFTSFYIDHCQAYFNAIGAVYPQAEIQYDYFHILQNIWRKVWGEFRCHRRDLKTRGEAAATKWYAEKLKKMAAHLWQHRYLFFKAEENLSAQEKVTMQEVLTQQPEMSYLRGFLCKVWDIFDGPTTATEAQEKLDELKKYAAYKTDNGYTKAISFLEEHFKNMTTFLRVPAAYINVTGNNPKLYPVAPSESDGAEKVAYREFWQDIELHPDPDNAHVVALIVIAEMLRLFFFTGIACLVGFLVAIISIKKQRKLLGIGVFALVLNGVPLVFVLLFFGRAWLRGRY